MSRRTVVLCQARHNHLRVALGAQGAALQQRLAEIHAARVDVQPAHVWVEGGPGQIAGRACPLRAPPINILNAGSTSNQKHA